MRQLTIRYTAGLDGNVRYTEAPERRAELLRRVEAGGYLSSSEAAVALGVSSMTIRRDLRQLAAQGLVQRVAGGASAVVPGRGAPFEQRWVRAIAEKEAVARAAAALLSSAAVVALDAGTTVAAFCGHLPGGLTVVTHSVPVITACTQRDDVELIALGGAYHPPTRSFTGPLTRAGLAELAVDLAVLSATAVSRQGLYSANASDAEVKREFARIADRVVVLLDHGKFGERAPMRFLSLDAVDTVVVDAAVAEDQLAMLRERCREVVVASTPIPPPAHADSGLTGIPGMR